MLAWERLLTLATYEISLVDVVETPDQHMCALRRHVVKRSRARAVRASRDVISGIVVAYYVFKAIDGITVAFSKSLMFDSRRKSHILQSHRIRESQPAIVRFGWPCEWTSLLGRI